MTNPYQTPESSDSVVSLNSPYALLDEVYKYQKVAIFSEDTPWPKRCIKCNRETDQTHSLNLTWVNPWAYLSILLSIFVLIIVVLIAQKKFKFDVPLCEEHQQKRKNSVLIRWMIFLAFSASLISGLLLQIELLIFLSIPLFLGFVVYAIMSTFAAIQKFKNGKIWLRGADKSFLESLKSIM